MKEYTCEWTVSVKAKSPQAAVNIARAIQLDPKNTANHFSVFDDEESGDFIKDLNADLVPKRPKLTEDQKVIRRLWDALSDILEDTSAVIPRMHRGRSLTAIAKAQAYSVTHPEVLS